MKKIEKLRIIILSITIFVIDFLLLSLFTNFSKMIEFNPNQSDLGMIQHEFEIRINPNHSDFGFIRIGSDSFGLMPGNKSD